MDKNTNTNTNTKLTNSLEQNISLFKKILRNTNYKFCIIFSDAMVDKDLIHEAVIEPLVSVDINETLNYSDINNYILKSVITTHDAEKTNDMEKVMSSIMYGETILLTENLSEVVIISTQGFKTRGISEPDTEMTIRGPKEAFSENLMINVSLLSKRVRNPKLKFIFRELGTQTKTKICVSYIEGVASPKILKELMQRLDKYNQNQLLYAEEIEEYIKDCPLSIFKTIGNSERPDVVAGRMLDGDFAIITDGTPYVLMAPFIFMEYFQSAEDYSANYVFASINRIVRFLAFFLGVSTPALYNAVITVHQELIPTRLILSISTARQGVPFPTVVEAIIMLIGFDMLREAGTRLPKPIGQTVSIVGALVLGEAAVNARLISAPMVIISAVTGICSLMIPKMLTPFIVLRLLFLVASTILGLYGYMFCIIGLFIYLTSMRSFGIPYTLYTSAVKLHDIEDTTIRAPWWTINYRPRLITKNRRKK
jgi:spore germination protein KA